MECCKYSPVCTPLIYPLGYFKYFLYSLGCVLLFPVPNPGNLKSYTNIEVGRVCRVGYRGSCRSFLFFYVSS
ncbi:hypothetical protein BDV28DRAFT_136206 [Aspergillus coremiiformis]|uniref:Uncharacterized protein n=1 Tax=Aspergillus coremiiformis TaxID=138285 RepID=A0A5N6Z445_9EURO|nr:hypothetical protein BDV28DRAFT_136206 [Aspergillus coremiiformis]